MSDSFQNMLRQRLEAREHEGLRRALRPENRLVDFASNDYLGLARSPELHELIDTEVDKYRFGNGSTGSRLLTGNSSYTEEVERYLAEFFQGQSALIFNSGYAANLAILSALPTRNDTIIYDELAHACIKDGARLSPARRFSFRHNDPADLELKMQKSTGRVFIAVESVYSMDGDEAPLTAIAELAAKYGAVVILDEAHSTGVVGKNGSGLAIAKGVKDLIAVRVYTFGKAMGVHGACVVGSDVLQQFLINFARPFIYTTALSPHSIASIHCAFRYLAAHDQLQVRLQENIGHYLQSTIGIHNKTISASPIQTLIVPGNDAVRSAAAQIQQKGFDVRPILSPTVPAGAERLRICLHAFNSRDEVENLCSLLQII